MKLIPLESISVENRQRTTIDRTRLNTLRDSILEVGLLHPIVVSRDLRLVAGERRFRAIESLHEDKQEFRCNGEPVPPGQIPTITVDDLPISSLLVAEFAENAEREDLSWQDRVRSLDIIHKQRMAEAERPSVRDTAKAIAEREVDSGHTSKPLSQRTIESHVTRAAAIAQHLDDPSIQNARNEAEAYQAVLRKQEEAYHAELVRRRTKGAKSEPARIQLRHGDTIELLPQLDPEFADLILVDPPYGANMNSAGLRSRTKVHHDYEDSPEVARDLVRAILIEGFRVAKLQANLFLFCDIDAWHYAKQAAQQAGWTVYRTPIIWQKSHSEGLAPWGRQGFRRTFEMVLYATKGQRGLYHAPVDILDFPRVPRNERVHGAQKPLPLLSTLIEASTLPGDFVLDPCAGSGSTLVAARDLHRRALGIEKDENAYNSALARIHDVPAAEEPALPLESADV